jgi:ABC-2 type transport system permease protein
MGIKAIAYRQLLHTVKQRESVFVDWVVYPLTMVVSFGLLVSSLSSDPKQLVYVLTAAILWRVAATFQTSVVVGLMEDVWHQTMRQTWALPIRLRDYAMGNMAFGLVSSMFTLVFTLSFAWLLFHVGVADWVMFALAYLVLVAFGAAVGLAGMALILYFGEGAQPANWVIMDMMVLASGVFYPISVLPLPVQFLAHFLPTTYVFLAVQYGEYALLGPAALLSVCYLYACWQALKWAMRNAKAKGKLVRMC